MTLGSFFNPKEIVDLSPFLLYSTTDGYNGKYIFPFLAFFFTDKKLDENIEELGLSALKNRPYELVSLLVYLNRKDVKREGGDTDISKTIDKEEMIEKLEGFVFDENIHDNIVRLLSIFGYINTSGILVETKLDKYFSKDVTAKTFYFCCYNIIRYSEQGAVYNYNLEDIFYLADKYVQDFTKQFGLKRLSNTSLIRTFGVGKGLTELIQNSTLYHYFDLLQKLEQDIEKKLYILSDYSDMVLIKYFKYEGEYESRMDLLSKLL